MFPLLGFSFRVFCVFRGLSSAPRIPKDGWDSRPYLALGKGHKKNGEGFVLAVVRNIAWPRLLALAAGVLGFHCQRLLADALAEVSQLGPAYLALTVDDHLLDAR